MWIKQLFIYMEKVVMLKKLFITNQSLVIVMWLVSTILHSFHGKQKKNFHYFLIQFIETTRLLK